jgi:hypothetical protein
MAIIYCDGDNPLAKGVAQEAAGYLVTAYPNHSWWVECRSGCLIIKHFEMSGARGTVGMVRHTSNLDHDAGARKKDIVRAAGEMMERAGLRRGANNGAPVTSFEFDDKATAKHWHAPIIKVPVIH